MVFTLFLFISSLGFANKCIDLYSVKYKSGLDKLKASVLDIANHPQIRNRTLRLDSKGEQIRFFNPIFHHILNKAARIFSQIPKGDTRLNIQSEFDDFIDKTLKKWNEGNFTYNDLIDLPLQVAVFFHEDWTQNQHLEAIRYVLRTTKSPETSEPYQKLIDEGIYVIPVAFSPDFELRSAMWTLKTPPISIKFKKFESVFHEDYEYSPMEHVEHDWGHALEIIRTASRPSRKAISMVENDIFNAIRKWNPNEKEVAFFVHHGLYPEAGLSQGINGKKTQPKSDLIKSLNYSEHLEIMKRFLEEPHITLWLFENLHLINKRIPVGDGRYVLFGNTTTNLTYRFQEGSKEDFAKFVETIRLRYHDLLSQVVDKYATELNSP